MPAAARRPLLRHLPMAAAILALLLPAAPALAQALVSLTVERINGQNVNFDAWQNVEVTEGSSIRFTLTADPAPTTQAEQISVGGQYISHLGETVGINDTVRRTSIAHFNNFTLNLATQDFGRSEDLYKDNDTYEGNRTVTVRINRNLTQPRPYKVDDAGSSFRVITITVTDEEDAYTPDVNGSNSVTADDALILYYAYQFGGQVGNGR